jgi:hypothetical protein
MDQSKMNVSCLRLRTAEGLPLFEAGMGIQGAVLQFTESLFPLQLTTRLECNALWTKLMLVY